MVNETLARVTAVHHNLVGLARVSTDAQDAQLQRDALGEAGCGRIFEEKNDRTVPWNGGVATDD